MDFRLVDGEKVRTVYITKASATVIEAGDLVAIDTGLAIKAVAASTAIAWAPEGAGDGETRVAVTVGNDFTLQGMNDADANFAVTQKGSLCDLKGTTTLIIDNDTSSTNVFQIDISENAGTAGSKAGIRVRINKPLF